MTDRTYRWDIFIAHAGADFPVAEDLYERLELQPRTFLDGRSLMLGDDWDRKLPQAQRASRITVVLVSRKTDKAYYQREEIANAIAMARKEDESHRVVPIYLEDLAEDEIPYGLRLKHAIWLHKIGGMDKAADALVDLLRQLKASEGPFAILDEQPREVGAALHVLQVCPAGLPIEVLCSGVRMGRDSLWKAIGAGLQPEAYEAGICRLAQDLPRKIVREDSLDLLADTLTSLLGYIGQHKSDGLGKTYAQTAMTLARACKDHRPDSVRGLFDALERILKRAGDKKLVFEAANLTIEATRHPCRTDEDVRIEAKARICGRSWVHQRVGHLDEARADAEKSLELGENVGWDRNTVYCRKCLGRLYRIEAERTSDETQKRELLKKSIEALKDAIVRFSKHPEFGPSDPEVGECHSLRGRTLLVAGQLNDVSQAIKKAEELLTDESSKDYIDFLILKGDFWAAKDALGTAEQCYDDALALQAGDDSEKSDIHARARFRRGLVRKRQGRTKAAEDDFDRAVTIWEALGERTSASEAGWEKIKLAGTLSEKSIKQLEKTGITARVIAAKIHQNRLAAVVGRNPRRAEPGDRYWDQVAHEAREVDAKQDIAW
jgi:tetratricopeptide (TPR) repeat protein